MPLCETPVISRSVRCDECVIPVQHPLIGVPPQTGGIGGINGEVGLEASTMQRPSNALYQWGAVAITVIAGAWTLFHIVWDLQKQTADDLWGQALLVLFVVSIILAFMRYAQERTALKAA